MVFLEILALSAVVIGALVYALTKKSAYIIQASEKRRKDTEAAFQQSDDDLRSMFLNIEEAYLRTDFTDGTILRVNPAAVAMLGYNREDELVGHKTTEKVWADPADRNEGAKLLLSHGRACVFVRWKKKDGTVLLLENTIRLIRDKNGSPLYVEGLSRDVTARDRAEQALKRSEASLAAVSKIAKIGGWDRSLPDLKMTWTSEMYRIFEVDPARGPLSQEELIARLHPDDREAFLAFQEKTRESGVEGPLSLDHRIILPSGATKYLVALAERQMDVQGNVTRVVGITQDITDRKLLEERLRQAIAQAEQATRTKSQFLANVSHEIRTPMNVISGLSHLALQMTTEPKPRDYLSKILAAANNLTAIVDDLLDFSKIELGKLEIESIDFDLNKVLTYIRNMLAQRAAEKSLGLVISVAPETPCELVGDPLRLGQILMNLTANAIKFTEQGKVTVSAELLRKDETDRAAFIRFTVQDTGIGISPEHLPKLFQSFVQADGSTTRKYGGTGLGLAISKQLVELMGGTIHAESVVNQGSRFFFEMKLALSSGQHPASERKGTAADAKAALPRPNIRVLVVDDHEINQLVAYELLESAGFSVAVAGDGKTAIEKLTSGGERFDVVLMDVQMPEMDGIEATRRIRQVPALKTLPIIAMTAHATLEEKHRCREAGMNDFISKPFDPRALALLISQWSEPKRSM